MSPRRAYSATLGISLSTSRRHGSPEGHTSLVYCLVSGKTKTEQKAIPASGGPTRDDDPPGQVRPRQYISAARSALACWWPPRTKR